ncbi:MAG TPA: hypothetical protein P5277_03520 [Candidatus Paceibacterota bacterium]|nr:hypothetical protein [Candidatus Paceibacterota bacterium]
MKQKEFALNFIEYLKKNNPQAERTVASAWYVGQRVYEYLENNNLPTDEKNLSFFAEIYGEAFRKGIKNYS